MEKFEKSFASVKSASDFVLHEMAVQSDEELKCLVPKGFSLEDMKTVQIYLKRSQGNRMGLAATVDRFFEAEEVDSIGKSVVEALLGAVRKLPVKSIPFVIVPFRDEIQFELGDSGVWKHFTPASTKINSFTGNEDGYSGFLVLYGRFVCYDVSALSPDAKQFDILVEPFLNYKVTEHIEEENIFLVETTQDRLLLCDAIPWANHMLMRKPSEKLVAEQVANALKSLIPKQVNRVSLFSSLSSSGSFRSVDWVGEITGTSEAAVRADPKKFVSVLKKPVKGFVDGMDLVRLGIKGKKSQTDAGCLAVATLGDLYKQMRRLKIDKSKRPVPKKECRFVFITRKGTDATRFVDVAAQQASKENEHAMFQVASNFNGVECPSEEYSPDTPNFLTNYVYDCTQGPTASISVGGAAITRCIAAFYDKKASPESWGQTKNRQLDMLENLHEYFKIMNGYVVNDGTEKRLPPRGSREYEELLNTVNVIAHLDADVTSGSRDKSMTETVENTHKVSQVFCAAMNVKQGVTGERNGALEDCADKVEFVLRAAYESTYAAAICNGSEKLFLGLVGGGTFGNDLALIHRIIAETHTRFLEDHNTCLRQVYLSYFKTPEESIIAQMKQDLVANGCPFEEHTL